MTNKDYINQYKGKDEIIATYYKLKGFSNNSSNLVTGIITPLEIDNTNLCAPTDNQLDSPHCAGYSTAQYLEALNWKKTGKLIQIDAHQIYAKAKELDGQVNVDGTYLEAVLQAGINLCGFKGNKIKTFVSDGTQNTIQYVKHILHKYDLCLVGFDITDAWYNCNKNDYTIKSGGRGLGGHAVLLVGYDSEGFIIQNHWGTDWGSKGFAKIPNDVFLKQFMYCAWLDNMYDNID